MHMKFIYNENYFYYDIYNEHIAIIELENDIYLNLYKRKQKQSILNIKTKEEKKDKKFDIKVSVIIPTYNSEELIGRCIESALNQTLKEIEILIVDDCSKDSTRSIIDEYKKKDKRIKSIFKEKNSGVGISRNLALEKAIGEFIGFLDADDYVDPGWYQYLYDNSKNMDIIRGIRVIHEFSDTYRKSRLKPYGCIVPSIIRKSFLDKYNIRFPKIRKFEDSHFNYIVKSKNPRTNLLPDNGIYYHYVKREGSLSNYKNPHKNITISGTETPTQTIITANDTIESIATETTTQTIIAANETIESIATENPTQTIIIINETIEPIAKISEKNNKYNINFVNIIMISVIIISLILVIGTSIYFIIRRINSNRIKGNYGKLEEANMLLKIETS